MGTLKPSQKSEPALGAGSEEEIASVPHLDGVRHRFIDLPDLRMHVAEAGSGDPLLLLHGFPQHWWAWRKVIPSLSQHYRVICPDLRGAGWTDAPPNGYTSDQLTADVIALLDALQLEKVHLIGYDWGGIVGYRLCLNHPQRVERFVNIATPHPYPRLHPRMFLHLWKLWPMFAVATPGLGPWLLRAGRQRLPRWMMTSDTSDPSVWSPEDIDLFVDRLRDRSRARAASTLYRTFILREARRSGAGEYRGTRLRVPTLSLYGVVLYGNNSTGKQPGILDGYEDHSDDLTMEYVPGTGFYIAEEQPDHVVARSLEFFGVDRPG